MTPKKCTRVEFRETVRALFLSPGTNQLSVIVRCPYYAGVRKTGFACKLLKLSLNWPQAKYLYTSTVKFHQFFSLVVKLLTAWTIMFCKVKKMTCPKVWHVSCFLFRNAWLNPSNHKQSSKFVIWQNVSWPYWHTLLLALVQQHLECP